jgi:hypothetical protein
VKFYTELNTAAAKKNIHTNAADFVVLAKAGKLPQVVYAWAPAGADEHPPSTPDSQ